VTDLKTFSRFGAYIPGERRRPFKPTSGLSAKATAVLREILGIIASILSVLNPAF